jgi:hypothetical protein
MATKNDEVQTNNLTSEANVPEKPRYIPEKELFNWTAKSRPFKKRAREYWVTIVAIAALLSFIMFLAEGTMPVILIISVVFLYYVLSTVEPHEVNFKITDKGIRIENKLTEWNILTRYWFVKRLDSNTLNFETTVFPGKIEMVVEEKDVPKFKSLLSKYLPEEEPEKTSVDKASDWVSKKILRT